MNKYLTIDDVIEDIHNIVTDHREIKGLTLVEIADRLDYPEKKTKKLIKKMIRAGKLKVVQVKVGDNLVDVYYS